jgi:predicted DNA-binding transcriptional regulator YafY
MRCDQQSRQWRVIRAIAASPNGLTMTGIAKREENGIRTIHRDPEALQATGVPPYTERVEQSHRPAFTNIFKFQVLFELTKEEYEGLRRQIGTLKRGEHSKYLPMAFTEQGEDNSDFLRITS